MLEDLLPRRANPERSGDAKQRVLTSPGQPRCRRIETIVPGAGRGSFRRKEGFPWPRANSPPPAPCRRSANSAGPSSCPIKSVASSSRPCSEPPSSESHQLGNTPRSPAAPKPPERSASGQPASTFFFQSVAPAQGAFMAQAKDSNCFNSEKGGGTKM